jgi:hypothetical protein
MTEVQLLDMTGRIVYEKWQAGNYITIKVDGFSGGVYLLKVQVKDELIFRKIMIR